MTPDEGRKILDECREKFLASLESAGALDKAAKILLEELYAVETKHFQKDGIVTDQRDVIAHGPRLKAIELLGGMYGLKAPDKHEVKHDISTAFRQLAATLIQSGDESEDNVEPLIPEGKNPVSATVLPKEVSK
jgi:hypothetical protein